MLFLFHQFEAKEEAICFTQQYNNKNSFSIFQTLYFAKLIHAFLYKVWPNIFTLASLRAFLH